MTYKHTTNDLDILQALNESLNFLTYTEDGRDLHPAKLKAAWQYALRYFIPKHMMPR